MRRGGREVKRLGQQPSECHLLCVPQLQSNFIPGARLPLTASPAVCIEEFPSGETRCPTRVRTHALSAMTLLKTEYKTKLRAQAAVHQVLSTSSPWGKWLQHVPQIWSCLFLRSHGSEQVRSAFSPAPPSTAKKRDVPVFIHFNVPESTLTVTSLAVGIGRDWQSWGCKVWIASDTSGSQTGTRWIKHEKNGDKFHGYSSLTLSPRSHFSQSCSAPNHPSSIIFLLLAQGHCSL